MTLFRNTKKHKMNNRLFLYSALTFIIILLIDAWDRDYSQPSTETTIIQNEIPETNIELEQETKVKTTVPETNEKYGKGFVTVITDKQNLKISLLDGSIIYAELLDYTKSQDKSSGNILLLDATKKNYIAKIGAQNKNKQNPASFSSPKKVYQMSSAGSMDVVLEGRTEDGSIILKTYAFVENSHLITVKQKIFNNSKETSFWRQYNSIERSEGGSNSNQFLYTYTGAAYYDYEEKFVKIDFDQIQDTALLKPLNSGWISMLEHYFLTAWIPYPNKEKSNATVYTKFVPNGTQKIYLIGSVNDYQEIRPNTEKQFISRLYIGPKNQKELESISENLVLTVDYGSLTFIAAPLFWILEKLFFIFGNWGWAIVFLTILIKLLFFKLSETSYRSMAKMKKLTPRMQSLKERFGEDKKKYSEALMRMYKEEKVNPLGGCLPILIQIPVFIALYWVLIESVEMRQAPFVAWITDLSSADPLFILPIAMGVSMYIQQKLNPTPVEPMQQKIFMFLPVIFTFLFATFPSGLVLYWLTNNILSIGQQYVINKRIISS